MSARDVFVNQSDNSYRNDQKEIVSRSWHSMETNRFKMQTGIQTVDPEGIIVTREGIAFYEYVLMLFCAFPSTNETNFSRNVPSCHACPSVRRGWSTGGGTIALNGYSGLKFERSPQTPFQTPVTKSLAVQLVWECTVSRPLSTNLHLTPSSKEK